MLIIIFLLTIANLALKLYRIINKYFQQLTNAPTCTILSVNSLLQSECFDLNFYNQVERRLEELHQNQPMIGFLVSNPVLVVSLKEKLLFSET